MSKEETKGGEVAVLKAEAADLSHITETFEVKTDDDMAALADRIKQVKEFRVKVEEKRDKTIEPAKAIIEEAKATYNPIIDGAKGLEATLKQKGVTYTIAKQKAEDEAKAKLAARVEKGTMKPETAVRKMEAMPETQRTVKTAASQFQVKTVQDIEIVDESKIPDEYFNRVLDTRRLKAAVITAKIEVPGVRVITRNQAAIR